MTGIIYLLLVGILIGFLAGKLIKGRGFGLIGNLLVGVGGSVLGGIIPTIFSSSLGLIGQVLQGVLGAVLLLFIIGWLKK